MLIAGWLARWMDGLLASRQLLLPYFCCLAAVCIWVEPEWQLLGTWHTFNKTVLFQGNKRISIFISIHIVFTCFPIYIYIYILLPFFVDILFSLHSSAGLFSSSAHERPGYKIYDIYVCINFECGWFRCVVAILMLNLFTNIFTSPSIYRYYIRWQSADVVNNCVRLLVQSLVLVSNHTHQIHMHTWRVYDTFNGKRKIHDESCTFYKKKFPSSIIKGMNRWWNSKYFCFAYNVLWNN